MMISWYWYDYTDEVDDIDNETDDNDYVWGYHYDDVIMTMLVTQITSLTVVYSIVYSGVNQRKHQSSASLAFVREIHRGPVNFPHKWPVTRKMFPFDDVIMSRVVSLLLPMIINPKHAWRHQIMETLSALLALCEGKPLGISLLP